MRTKKHYEGDGTIDTPNVHGDEKWKNITRMLKQKYGENLTGGQICHEMSPIKTAEG